MNFVNKLTLREFPSADVILLLQMVSVVLVIYPLKVGSDFFSLQRALKSLETGVDGACLWIHAALLVLKQALAFPFAQHLPIQVFYLVCVCSGLASWSFLPFADQRPGICSQ